MTKQDGMLMIDKDILIDDKNDDDTADIYIHIMMKGVCVCVCQEK